MGAGHAHQQHTHDNRRRTSRRRLVATLVLVVLYMGVEAVGGLLTNSVRKAILGVELVCEVHDLHVWSIASGFD